MQRYLLFDSGCTTCNALAQIVADESKGWLEIRSLREPAMQELLNRARPGWQWEPTLLAIEGEQMKVFTGVQLRFQVVRGLGLRQAARIIQLISQLPAESIIDSSRRRQFLKVGGATIGGLALGLGLSFPKRSFAATGVPPATDATPLAITDPVIAKMKNSRHLRLARKHFGAPDWKQVFKITYGPDKKTGYAIFLDAAPPQGSKAAAKTLLVFGNEPQARHVGAKRQANGKRSGQNKVLVFRMTPDTNAQMKVEWFTPSATLLVVSTLTRSGQHSVTTVAADDSFKCTLLCGALTVACRADCTVCAVVPAPPDCAACALCIGAAYIACSDCLGSGIDASGVTSSDSGSDSGGGSDSGSHIDSASGGGG